MGAPSIKKYTVALYAGAALLCICENLTGSCLNDIMTYYNMDLSNGGLMTFFQYIGCIASVLVFSKITDLMKKPVMLIIASGIMAALLFGIGALPGFAVFILLYLLFGAALSIVDTLNNAIPADLYPHKRNSALLILQGVCGVGATVMPVIIVFMGTSNLRLIYRSVAVVIFIIVLLQIIMYRAENKGINRIYEKTESDEVRQGAKKLLSDKNIWLAIASMLFFGLSQGGVITWVVKYSIDVFPNLTQLHWSLTLSIYWMGATLCRLLLGALPALKRLDIKNTIIIGGIAAGAALILGIISGNYYGFAAGVFLYGILNGATLPNLATLMSIWYP